MFPIWVVFHVIVCLALIAVVLMQSSKGEGLAGTSFGGGMSSAVFGGRGAASFLSKATTILAVVFFVNCGALALMSANRSGVVGTTTSTPTESPITQQAQAERERAIQQQQAAQQRQGADTVNIGNIQVEPPAPPQQGSDQSGEGGGQ